ncbi:cytochrome c-type biogenesis protein [Thermincola potens]|uniref:Cytochrome c-type biogenesis protein n=1 Tax=Thermincola potens (strain JR) TaxID=635013 RepID=D5X9Z1_THEPJ|nr:cytochrome c-type biogenesis protein CcmH [Thermincola potens]ADG83124.1 hypothetical protein TherJR_2281 [Thermincola potens JR]
MAKRLMILLGIIGLLLTANTMVATAAENRGPTGLQAAKMQKELEDMLVCQDSCGMLVSACENSTAEYMRGIIKQKMAEGRSKEEILAYFVSIYGEQVLAAPPAKGFNITAWVTPFIFVLAGGILIYTVVDKWVFTNRLEEDDSEMENSELQEEKLELYQDKLQEELRKRW